MYSAATPQRPVGNPTPVPLALCDACPMLVTKRVKRWSPGYVSSPSIPSQRLGHYCLIHSPNSESVIMNLFTHQPDVIHSVREFLKNLGRDLCYNHLVAYQAEERLPKAVEEEYPTQLGIEEETEPEGRCGICREHLFAVY
ncbi:hypothetical protein J6590_056231 [Homalodisca vitripennis]|nr:hypothetical protein J6590_056231 [Homalodisca vitripennis]